MKTVLAPYWIGVFFGLGTTLFIAKIGVETGVLPPWPHMPISLVGSCGAVIAMCAVVSAVAYKRTLDRNLTKEDNSDDTT